MLTALGVCVFVSESACPLHEGGLLFTPQFINVGKLKDDTPRWFCGAVSFWEMLSFKQRPHHLVFDNVGHG